LRLHRNAGRAANDFVGIAELDEDTVGRRQEQCGTTRSRENVGVALALIVVVTLDAGMPRH